MSAPTAALPQLPLRHCYWVVPGLLLAGEHPGGPTRDKIRVYHTAKAKKIPPGGPYDHSLTPAEIDKIVANIKAARRPAEQWRIARQR